MILETKQNLGSILLAIIIRLDELTFTYVFFY